MAESSRRDTFDRWAEKYDETVPKSQGFPFDGYDAVLDEVVARAGPLVDRRVLDLGSGTGNLTERITKVGGEVWALDFSEKMLERARKKLPDVKFFQADVLVDLPPLLRIPFDAVLSTYVLHEFPLMTKVSLIGRIAKEHLAPGGRIVIGDISFETSAARDAAVAEAGDDDEEYWVADVAVPTLESAGFTVTYTQVSPCGGVYTLDR
jgi:putative AdoMet-dependent methyltransferase